MTISEMRSRTLNRTKQLVLELEIMNRKIIKLYSKTKKLRQELKENFIMPPKVRPATNDDLIIGTVFWLPETKSVLIADIVFISYADFSNESFNGFFVEIE